MTEGITGKLIPLQELNLILTKMSSRFDWKAIFDAIPEGYGQEVTISEIACFSAIKRFEQLAAIPSKEFIVKTRRHKGEPKRVFIIHRKVP